MTSQTANVPNSNIVNLFAESSVAETNFAETGNAQRVELILPVIQPKKRDLNGLPLQITQLKAEKKSSSFLAIFTVLGLHALAIYLLSTHKPLEKIEVKLAKPMMVSLIAPLSPKPQKIPEHVPIIEPPEPKPVVENKPKPKKVVEKIRQIEKPVERLVEATTELIQEPPKEEEVTKPEASPVLVSEPTKEMPKAAPIIEDKYEEPRFGVAYLNNPAPEYPAMSRRQGEEGRVLMKVLVSAEGAVETVQIEKSSGTDRLDNAAVTAVKKWRFIPTKRNNQPLSAYVLVPMKFSLDN